jgi:hypothetical protein
MAVNQHQLWRALQSANTSWRDYDKISNKIVYGGEALKGKRSMISK